MFGLLIHPCDLSRLFALTSPFSHLSISQLSTTQVDKLTTQTFNEGCNGYMHSIHETKCEMRADRLMWPLVITYYTLYIS